jgi:hypothetical protein
MSAVLAAVTDVSYPASMMTTICADNSTVRSVTYVHTRTQPAAPCLHIGALLQDL